MLAFESVMNRYWSRPNASSAPASPTPTHSPTISLRAHHEHVDCRAFSPASSVQLATSGALDRVESERIKRAPGREWNSREKDNAIERHAEDRCRRALRKACECAQRRAPVVAEAERGAQVGEAEVEADAGGGGAEAEQQSGEQRAERRLAHAHRDARAVSEAHAAAARRVRRHRALAAAARALRARRACDQREKHACAATTHTHPFTVHCSLILDF